jgi:hypothetical protein
MKPLVTIDPLSIIISTGAAYEPRFRPILGQYCCPLVDDDELSVRTKAAVDWKAVAQEIQRRRGVYVPRAVDRGVPRTARPGIST